MKTDQKLSRSIFRSFIIFYFLYLAGVISGCRAVGTPTGNNFDEEKPKVSLSDFPLSTETLVLFSAQGEQQLSALLDEKTLLSVMVSWSVDTAGIVELVPLPNAPLDPANPNAILGSAITVRPLQEGLAQINARLIPKDGVQLASGTVSEANCQIAVFDDFTLDAQKLLFFENESAPQTVRVNAPSNEARDALLKVARVLWSSTSNAVSLPVDPASGLSSGMSIALGALLPNKAKVTASLEPLHAAGINVTQGILSAALNVNTLSAPLITITDPGSVALDTGDTSKDYMLSAAYPLELDEYSPSFSWASSNAAQASVVTPASAAGGISQTTLTAKKAGSVEIEASVLVEGRTFHSAPLSLNVGKYAAVSYPPQKITLSGVAAGGLTLAQTNSSSVITALAERLDQRLPDDAYINWHVSPANIVTFEDVPDSSGNNSKKKIRSIAPGTATVKASSRAAAQVEASLSVTVLPLTVTISGPAALTRGGGTITLNGTTNADNKNISAWNTQSSLITLKSAGNSTEVELTGLPTADTAVIITAQAAADASVTGSHSLTLKPHTFNITFNPGYSGGGIAPYHQDNVTYGSAVPLTPNSFTRPGYTFDSWAASSGGAGAIADRAAVNALKGISAAQSAGGRVQLYAAWKEIVSVDSVTVAPAADSRYLPLLYDGDTATLEAAVSVTGSITDAVEWVSSNPALVSIESFTTANAVIKARGSGKAKIRAVSKGSAQMFFDYEVRAFNDSDAMAGGGAPRFVKAKAAGSQTYTGYDEIHLFSSASNATSTFQLSVSRAPADASTRALIVAGGGGAGASGTENHPGAGGGAGGLLEKSGFALPVNASPYQIQVGKGGAGSASAANGAAGESGASSSFNGWTAEGGGGGASHGPSIPNNGNPGGSGGGAAGSAIGGGGKAGQGNAGGGAGSGGTSYRAAGGGGAAKAGGGVGDASVESGKGGDGKSSDISGAPVFYAGGGGGGPKSGYSGGGQGGGGQNGGQGVDGLGGGGGGGCGSRTGGRGGSGVVIVRFAFNLYGGHPQGVGLYFPIPTNTGTPTVLSVEPAPSFGTGSVVLSP
jgi:uncharacterized repeat protein (TIGR02543 family)